MRPLSWPQVAVIGMILTAVVTLAALGQDTSALVGLGTLMLAGLGLIAGQVGQVARQTNGAQSELVELVRQQSQMMEGLAHKMALMVPVDQEKPTEP